MKNLFAKDTAKQEAKKTNKTTVELKGQENNLKQLMELDEQIAALQAQRQMIDNDVRQASKNAMLSVYESKKSFPGTVVVQAGSMELQFITADRYSTLDEERATELTEKYGENLVNEDTKFSFNTDVLMRNMDAINKMIVNSKEISEADKENLIDQKTTWSVAKGTIKNLKNEEYAKFELHELVDDIKPVFSIKSIKEC